MIDRDEFSTTMRIDITTHMPEVQGVSGELQQADRKKSDLSASSRQQSEEHWVGSSDFQELLQNLYDGAVLTDKEGLILSANKRALHFFNCSQEQLTGRSITGIILGADDALISMIRENLTKNQFTLIQAFCEREDQSLFPAEISVNKLMISGAYLLSFFIRDITLRRENEDQLRTGFNAIQNSANGIAIADLEANYVYVNASMRQLLGHQEDEPVDGHTIREYMTDGDRAEEIIQAIRERQTWRGELQIRRCDGAKLYVNASVAPNSNADGDLTGMVISLLDISEQKKAQEQLERYAAELRERNDQMVEDLNMARDVQEALLPRDYPDQSAGAACRIQCAHVYYPSDAVGGDFFNVLRISDEHVGVFLCDVMGHGMRAALVVATICGLSEQLSGYARKPAEFLTRLNQAYNAIFGGMNRVTFATAFYAVVNMNTGSVEYVTAGHPPPFILSPSRNTAEQLDVWKTDAKGPAIGLFEDSVYGEAVFQLASQDVMLLFTDGLAEELNDANEYYETDGLQAYLAAHKNEELNQLLTGLAADSLAFSGRKAFSDDVCLFAVKYTDDTGCVTESV